MLKLRIPYSGVAGLITGLILTGPMAPIIGLSVVICIELFNIVIIHKSLTSKNEFAYDSFVGHLLLQYVLFPDVSYYAVLQLVCARIAACILAIIIFSSPPNVGFWTLFLPALLFLATIIHYVPKQKSL